jgi:hypothetical protein
MESRVNACDPGRLHQLAEGQLTGANLASLEDHLHGCQGCEPAKQQAMLSS